MGLQVRLECLMAEAHDQLQRARIKSGGRRLVDTSAEGGMGRQYFALGLTSGPSTSPRTEVWPFTEG